MTVFQNSAIEPLYEAGFAGDMFRAVTAVCALPESAERTKMFSALADAIVIVVNPAFKVDTAGIDEFLNAAKAKQ
jgi:hypothetical protein